MKHNNKIKVMKKTIGLLCAGAVGFMLMASTTCSNEDTTSEATPVIEEKIEVVEKEVKSSKGISFIQGDLAKAKKQAEKEGKLIFIDCYTDWCGPCKRMAGTTFKDPEVAKFFNENFINLKVEMEKDASGPELAKQYKVAAYPTLLFIDNSGNLKKTKIGFADKGSLMALAKSLL